MEQKPPASTDFVGTTTTSGRNETAFSGAGYRESPDKPRKRHRWIWIVLLAIFAIAFFLILKHKPLAAAKGGGRRGDGGPVTLNAEQAHLGDMAIKLSSIGTVTPTYTASITAQVTGKIVAVHYRQGQTVEKGSPLIDIDPRPYQAALDTAKGALLRDLGVLAQAQMDLARYQAAWARNAIARQMLDDQAKLVDQDKGLVQSDQGTVEADQVNVAYCHIASPIRGMVGLRLVDPGNLVQASGTTPLAVITQIHPITVIFTIPEDNLPQVEQAMRQRKLAVTVFDRTGKTTLGQGTLETTDNQIDTTTGTLKLRAVFVNTPMMLFPNQFVNTELLVNTLQNQVLIPDEAIQHNGSQAYVYLLQNNTAKMTTIKILADDQVNSAVTGLKNGDLVATSSFEKLQDKSKVRVVKQKLAVTDSEETDTP
jgi:multidrug efflux system membrane fusion protein